MKRKKKKRKKTRQRPKRMLRERRQTEKKRARKTKLSDKPEFKRIIKHIFGEWRVKNQGNKLCPKREKRKSFKSHVLDTRAVMIPLSQREREKKRPRAHTHRHLIQVVGIGESTAQQQFGGVFVSVAAHRRRVSRQQHRHHFQRHGAHAMTWIADLGSGKKTKKTHHICLKTTRKSTQLYLSKLYMTRIADLGREKDPNIFQLNPDLRCPAIQKKKLSAIPCR